MSGSSRKYDLVLFGATGFTGQYTAEHIARSLPTNLSWALAGRSYDKVAGVARSIKSLNPDRKDPAIEVAQLNSTDLTALAKSTRLIINTVGPYCLYGEPVVKACAENGTHYVDVTGEAPWVKDMVDKYHNIAKTTGAIIMPEIGLESVPADILTFAVSNFIREKFNDAPTKEVVLTTHAMKMAPSGGTLSTIRSIFDVYSLSYLAKSGSPSSTCPISVPKHSRPSILQMLFGYRWVPELGTLSTSIQAASDVPIVYRSWGLLTQGGAGYGGNFKFSPHVTVRNAVIGALVHLALVFTPLLFVLRPIRWIMSKLVYAPGTGPSREASKDDFAEWRAVGYPDSTTDQKAVAKLKFPGSAYHMTGITLSEGAATILYDLDETMARKIGGGVLTAATLGKPYLERLEKAGLKLEMTVA